MLFIVGECIAGAATRSVATQAGALRPEPGARAATGAMPGVAG